MRAVGRGESREMFVSRGAGTDFTLRLTYEALAVSAALLKHHSHFVEEDTWGRELPLSCHTASPWQSGGLYSVVGFFFFFLILSVILFSARLCASHMPCREW